MSVVRVKAIWEGDLKFTGENAQGHITRFESSANKETATASSPMEVLILKKRRKTVTQFTVEVEAERAEEHPRVYTKIFLRYVLTSPDALLGDLIKAVELSLTKYCPVSAMLRKAGVELHHEVDVLKPQGESAESA